MTVLPINNECSIRFKTKNPPSPDDSLELVDIMYQTNQHVRFFWREVPLAIMREIKPMFDALLKNNFQLPSNITPYNVGYEYSQQSHKYYLATDEDGMYTKEMDQYNCSSFYKHSFFSNDNMLIFLYNVDNKIIMEISPSYKWDTIDPKEGEIIPTFEAFMLLYAPIAIHEISKKNAQNWLKQAEEYLSIVEPQFEEWCKTPGEHQNHLYRFEEEA